MTPENAITIAGGLILVSALLSWLMSLNFCTRPAPRWLRSWRDVALALAGARLVYRGVVSNEPEWWSTAIWLLLAAFGVLIAIVNVKYALGPDGDRCGRDDQR